MWLHVALAALPAQRDWNLSLFPKEIDVDRACVDVPYSEQRNGVRQPLNRHLPVGRRREGGWDLDGTFSDTAILDLACGRLAVDNCS